MKVELLYLEGCPNYQPTLLAVEHAISEEGIAATITSIKVTDPNTRGFLGSPTVLINGSDLQLNELAVTPSGLACRSYANDGVLQGFPPQEMVKSAVRRARSSTYPPVERCVEAASVSGFPGNTKRL